MRSKYIYLHVEVNILLEVNIFYLRVEVNILFIVTF